ncbi:MAG: MutS-related protein [Candidatus Omnitrophota bacterium]
MEDKPNQAERNHFYKSRIDTLDTELGEIKKKSVILSTIKLSLIAVIIILLILKLLSWTALAVLMAGIIITFIIHEPIIKKQERNRLLHKINENEIKYLDYRFPSPDFGEAFTIPDHHYTWDLDIFVERGLFHFINRATTMPGKMKMAECLNAPFSTDRDALYQRQEAVTELAGKVDFRQEIQYLGTRIENKSKSMDSLYNLFSDSPYLFNHRIQVFFIYLLPVLSVLVAASCLIFHLTCWAFFGSVCLQFIVNKFTARKAHSAFKSTSRNFRTLKGYADILTEIENQSFTATVLQQLQHALVAKDQSASVHIKKLASLLGWFELRIGYSALHFVLNNLVLWDLQCIYRIEKWLRETRTEIPKWMDVLGHVEALSSLGTLAFNHPHWTMPQFEPEFHFEAKALGHPLIPEKELVRNDMKLNKKGDILIITGPNMAGKSTFLRTVGVNIVLAFAGAPVFAEHFKLSPLNLYTCMKASDSLDKGLSLFYAELLRLKKIMDAVLNNEPVFFITDEMLKGTNVLDRQKGSIALIKQFISSRTNGIVATHDLELADLEKAYPHNIINHHFDSYVEADKLFFTYKLKPGLCNSFNALILMKKIGIILD